MQIMNATEEDKDELLALYHAMIGGPCEWSETYPDENTIAFDLKNEDLFVMKLEFDCDSYNLIQEFYNKRALYCCSTATTFHRHFSRKGGSRNIKL